MWETEEIGAHVALVCFENEGLGGALAAGNRLMTEGAEEGPG